MSTIGGSVARMAWFSTCREKAMTVSLWGSAHPLVTVIAFSRHVENQAIRATDPSIVLTALRRA